LQEGASLTDKVYRDIYDLQCFNKYNASGENENVRCRIDYHIVNIDGKKETATDYIEGKIEVVMNAVNPAAIKIDSSQNKLDYARFVFTPLLYQCTLHENGSLLKLECENAPEEEK